MHFARTGMFKFPIEIMFCEDERYFRGETGFSSANNMGKTIHQGSHHPLSVAKESENALFLTYCTKSIIIHCYLFPPVTEKLGSLALSPMSCRFIFAQNARPNISTHI
jgi:hypothetical protein